MGDKNKKKMKIQHKQKIKVVKKWILNDLIYIVCN